MSRNDAEDFAQSLYARVPNHYRVYDAERGLPLLALLRVVGAQAANLRQDLDRLWDNFFIETCEDWAVPYLAALVGTNLLQQPVGQSNRLDVWNTVLWRRSKGTPLMLQALAQSSSGWLVDLAEFFQSLGWSQNLNHVRIDRPLTPDLRDPFQIRLLGHAGDPFAHAADFKPAAPLDESRVAPNTHSIGVAAWGTPGRYQIKNLGVFVRRLRTFPVRGVTPAAVAPGGVVPPAASNFTFNPLFRDTPLFAVASGLPISRADFGSAPWDFFDIGSDIAVRKFGVMLAAESAPSTVESAASAVAFQFGDLAPGFSLNAAAGMRLLDSRSFQLGSAHFLITAKWQRKNTFVNNLGFLSTLNAATGTNPAFVQGKPSSGAGQLVISVQLGRFTADVAAMKLQTSPAARFPGAIVAVRAARTGALHAHDGLYVYLPPTFLKPGDEKLYFVSDDGSTFTSPDLTPSSLVRGSQGQVYPARSLTPSTLPVSSFARLVRDTRFIPGNPGGVFLTDAVRFAGAGFLVEAALYTGPSTFQPLGAVATINQSAANFPDLQLPAGTWPALTYAPSKKAVSGDLPPTGILSVTLGPLTAPPSFMPPAELVIRNRAGQALLVYLPELSFPSAANVTLLVASDGSTYFAPTDAVEQQRVLQQGSFSGLKPARAAQGQALPIAGLWPLQQRLPVAINLCRPERSALLALGELGIDPELGRFALPSQDPALGAGSLSVDFVEALSDSVGAVNSTDRQIQPGSVTRLVSQSGDADSPLTGSFVGAPVHFTLADAIAAAKDGDVIEIVDSATYSATSGVTLSNKAVQNLTIRAAAGQRPCFTFFKAGGQPLPFALSIAAPMTLLEINGLWISGGPLQTAVRISQLRLISSTLDPAGSAGPSLVSTDKDRNSNSGYLLSRCVVAGLVTGLGVSQLIVADSILDSQSAPAGSPPSQGRAVNAARTVQLERVTVLGTIFCDILNASESLLNDKAIVADQQAGCIRFTRFETGSVLPRRYRCVPAESQACPKKGRCVAPLFNSRRFGHPAYVQLAAGCPNEILTAAEGGAEVGAFAAGQNTIRLQNLRIKLQEFMPVGLSAVVVAET
jgi:hypothetical protein